MVKASVTLPTNSGQLTRHVPHAVVSNLLLSKPKRQDATLLQAWASWLEGERAYRAAPDDEADDSGAPHNIMRDAAKTEIERLGAWTPAVVAAKLRLALSYYANDGAINRVLVNGIPLAEVPTETVGGRMAVLLPSHDDVESMAAA